MKPDDSQPFRGAEESALRFVRPRDVPALVDLVNRAYEHERWLIPGPRLLARDVDREWFAPHIMAIVATMRGAPIGTVRVRFADEHGRALAIPELGLLAVDPTIQRRRIGKQLVRGAEDIARNSGHAVIELRCGHELGLEAYYRALGYERVDAEYGTKFGSFQPFTLVTMRRRLSSIRPIA